MISTRRSFLALSSASVAMLATPAIARNQPLIKLREIHTGSACDVSFDGAISSKEYKDFVWTARDWRQHKTIQMDPNLMKILSGICREAGSDETFDLISGYRTPKTNAMLTGTAKHSQHIPGHALDIRRSDLSTHDLYKIAWGLQLGGVGYYPQARNRFVHVDTGRVRTW